MQCITAVINYFVFKGKDLQGKQGQGLEAKTKDKSRYHRNNHLQYSFW